MTKETALEGLTRRGFIQLLGAGAAFAGGCDQPTSGKIVPYTRTPPELTPGIPQHYATAMVIDGYATGLVVDSHVGRPTKIEGNPEHPASLGAAGVLEQAWVLSLYDPDRGKAIAEGRELRTAAQLESWLSRSTPAGGEGVWFVMPPTSSPLVVDLIARVRSRLPAARFVFHSGARSPFGPAAARLAFGRPLETQLDFRQARTILSLDADVTAEGPFHLRHARDIADGRRLGSAGEEMSRLYVVESMLTPTGSLADHRLRVRPTGVAEVAAGVLREVLAAVRPDGVPADLSGALAPLAGRAPQSWVAGVARDLLAHRGAGVAVAGPRQPPAVHLMAHAINAALGNVGRTVVYTESPIFEQGEASHDLAPLVSDRARLIVVLDGNPVYDAPADLDVAAALARAPSVYLGLHRNETAHACRWFAPALHGLESWGDARAKDGTVSTIQPLIAPLVPGLAPEELLARFAGEAGATTYSLLRERWRRNHPSDFEPFWEETLRRGFVPETASAPVEASWSWDVVAPALARLPGPQGLEVSLVVDPKVHDGRFGNNAWLQELPAPMTKLTWDNAAVLSPATAARLAVQTGDVLAIAQGSRNVRAPAFVLPGHADDAITLSLGYGRDGGESLARGVGVDAGRLRTGDAPHGGPGFTAARTGERRVLAMTQEHWSMEGRPIALQATLAEYRQAGEKVTARQKGRLPTLLDDYYTPQAKNQWGMTIDLGACNGCSACVVACQAENNTPVVGPEQVRLSREMHWLRIDRYFVGNDPRVVNQPMMCQHCEKAPCEYVCPVNATVHSDDGLNEMVYNRCIGTRFCSNNCPYKVRRFNYFSYVRRDRTELQKNPDVTVRERGVMEKCTYCVQRIRRGEIAARLERRELGGNEIRTACQQACPSRAIVFGSLGDPGAEVSRLRSRDRSYEVLHELGTKPRTHYLVRILNPNPEVER